MAVDPAHPFPFLPNLSSSIVLLLEGLKSKKLTALITFPPNLERFFKIFPHRDLFIKTKDIIFQIKQLSNPGEDKIPYMIKLFKNL